MDELITKNELQNITAYTEATETFLNSISIKPTTKDAYRKGLKNFYNFMQATNQRSINEQTIILYREYLIEHNEAPSINLYLTALKRLCKYLSNHYNFKDITAELKGIRIKSGHKKDGLNINQAKELLNAPTSKRDKAIITLFLTGALREIELVRANIEDITTKGDRIILKVQGKGHDKKDDHIIITISTYKAINEYLATRKNPKANEPLFISDSNHNQNGRLSTRSIRRLVKKYLIQIGINTPKITTHSLRHTAITQALLNNGKNIFEAQKFARHTNPNTTQVYIDEIADEEAKSKSADILENIYNNWFKNLV